MVRIVLMIVVAATLLAVTGCHSTTGSRQFVPGSGWVPAK
jgi:hypothetical protein